ncbi:MAG: MaoC/PaaZ C-terminal domain-containing protein [bacterium]|nr:MaoC/PaaZ C-terminal domain-containing protein [bacterium]MDE0669869.1 MaoC/PaaZ C-terminal domain-containing protein [bacterium]
MPINPDALGAKGSPVARSWNSKDCLLYALGVGAGMDDPVGSELEFTTENSHEVTQKALPTMCVVLGDGMAANPDSPLRRLGSFNPALLLHGEQTITLHRPLPTEATISTVAEITGVYDKGKAAVVEITSRASDTADGQPMYTNVATLVLRGEGGFGGDRGPSAAGTDRPDRDPEAVVSYTTRTDQALLYRLNGDRNPLHSDPAFAALAGFDRPILHGLCTYGFTGRALLAAVCDGHPERFGAMYGRFTAPVFPGDRLDVHVWIDGDRAWYRTLVADRPVIDNGTLTLA